MTTIGDVPNIDFPTVQRATLSNGVEIVYAQSTTVPVTRVAVEFDAGYAADDANSLGVHSMMLTLMNEGTTTRDSNALAEAQERLGASVNVGASMDRTAGRQRAPIDDPVDPALLDPHFSAPPPKSTGRELFTPDCIARCIAQSRAARAEATPHDIIATAGAFTARSIADAYERFLPEPIRDVVVSGGGAKNPALVEAIAARLPGKQVIRFDDVFFDGEAKEAVAFALLGYLHLMGEAGNIPAATGAAGPRILGKLTPA